MRKTMLVAACLVAGASVAAFAGPKEGTIEVGGTSVGGFSTLLAKGGGSAFALDAIGGYYLMPEVELKGIVSFEKAKGQDSQYTIMAGADYVFAGSDPWVPYAGGGFGFINGYDDKGKTETKFAGQIHGGVHYFFNDSVSANGEVNYKFQFSHIGDGVLSMGVGLSVYFGL